MSFDRLIFRQKMSFQHVQEWNELEDVSGPGLWSLSPGTEKWGKPGKTTVKTVETAKEKNLCFFKPKKVWGSEKIDTWS